MSTLRVTTITNPSGGQPTIDGLAKAWVNFNGTGTVAIRASLNVSSITDNGTGDYTVNFTTAMTDANYSVSTAIGLNVVASIAYMVAVGQSFSTVSATRVTTWNGSPAVADCPYVNVAIFR
jgi:hypothetical protein